MDAVRAWGDIFKRQDENEDIFAVGLNRAVVVSNIPLVTYFIDNLVHSDAIYRADSDQDDGASIPIFSAAEQGHVQMVH